MIRRFFPISLPLLAATLLAIGFGTVGANTDGIVNSFQKISGSDGKFTGDLIDGDVFGKSIANVGDLDNDGVIDLAVGTQQDDDGGADRGAVWILFMNTDGTVKTQQKISDTAGNFGGALDNGDRFGSHVTSIGDLDGDGVTDLAAGAERDDDGGVDAGAIWILFMNTNGTVKSQQKISAAAGNLGSVLDSQDSAGPLTACLTLDIGF